MRDQLAHILATYPSASRRAFTNHPLAHFIRHDAAEAVRVGLGDEAQGFLVRASAGMGQWSDSPFLALLDPIVTSTPQDGYYIAYLFSRSMDGVALSLQLGATATRAQLGNERAVEVLRRLATAIRTRVPEYTRHFSDAPINLQPASKSSRAAFYEAGHAFGVTYGHNLPAESVLLGDLRAMARLYRLLTFRGGLDPTGEAMNDFADAREADEAYTGYTGAEDLRRLRYHRRIERNRKLSAEAKKIHGPVCAACGFDFETTYGAIGKGYIEAHHLTPLSELPRDRQVPLDPRRDFTVLCANCHRMIHRKDAPRSVHELRTLVRSLRPQ